MKVDMTIPNWQEAHPLTQITLPYNFMPKSH